MPTLTASTTLSLPAGQALLFRAGSGRGEATADQGGRTARFVIGPDDTRIGPWSTAVSVDVVIASGSVDYIVDQTGSDQTDQAPGLVNALMLTASGLAAGGQALTASQRAVIRSDAVEVTVSDFLAAGDGTDQTAKFNAAKSAAGVAGRVYVGPGVYVLSEFELDVAGQSWTLHRNAEIRSSNAATLFAMSITADDVSIFGGYFNNQALSGDAYAEIGSIKVESDRVSIRGGSFRKSRGPCIYGSGCNHISIVDNKFYDTWYAGVFIRPLSEEIYGVTVSGNTFECNEAFAGYKYGINVHNDASALYNVNSVNVSGNRLKFPLVSSGAYPLPIEVFGSGSGIVKDVVISGNTVNGGGIGISASGCQDAVISSNTVNGAYQYGIESVSPANVVVSGNMVTGGATANTRRGVSVSEAGTGIAVTGNAISNTQSAGVYVSGVGNDVVISNNNIRVTAGFGVNVLSTSRYSISGNTINGNGTGTKGIMLDKSDKGSVTGNVISNMTQNGVLFYADAAVAYNRVNVTGNCFFNTPNSLNLATQLSGGASIGAYFSYVNNMSDVDSSYRRDILDVLNTRISYEGTGSPEGVFSASRGSRFFRTDGGAATTLYVKESGTGNTGWAAK